MAPEIITNEGRQREASALEASGHLPGGAYDPSFLEFAIHAVLRRCRLPRSTPQFLVLLAAANLFATAASSASTLRVPADFPTIQSAIQAAAPDDTILVAPGIYPENLDTLGKRLTLIGEAGPEATVVDGGGRARVLRFAGGGVVEGFTFRRGRDPDWGGGLWVGGQSGTVIRNNIIEDNVVGYPDYGVGGGIYLDNSVPRPPVIIESNQIENNYAGASGGGVYDLSLYTEIRENVISGNRCHLSGGGALLGGTRIFVGNLVRDNIGGGVFSYATEVRSNTVVGNVPHGILISEGAIIANNLVASNQGIGIECASVYTTPTFRCNDSWNNDVNYYFIGASCDSSSGRNFSADPLFCNPEQGDFRISERSPCAPGSSECGLVGAFGVGCGATSVQPTTWGRIKASFR